jgi:hypothetical protein
MIPTDFKQADRLLRKQRNFDHDQAYDFPVFMGADTDRTQQVLFLHFQPSKEDKENIKNGSGIWVKVFAPSLPPLHLQTENPFADVDDLFVWLVGLYPTGDHPHLELRCNGMLANENHFISDDYFTEEQINQLNFLFDHAVKPEWEKASSKSEANLLISDFRRSIIDKLKSIEKESQNNR